MTEPVQYSNRLDLDQFFFHARDQIYVIAKLEHFPNYYRGSDIDVFCYDKDQFAKRILSVGNQYLNRGFEIEVHAGEVQTHIDFYFEGELDFRFDLYQSLPDYKRIQLKKHYIFSVIENAVQSDREFDGVTYPVYEPAIADSLLLRYVEYIEWYELRPDKIKHLDYIINAVASDPNRIKFLDKLHLYTAVPPATSIEDADARGPAKRPVLAFWWNRFKSIPHKTLIIAYTILKKSATAEKLAKSVYERMRSRKQSTSSLDDLHGPRFSCWEIGHTDDLLGIGNVGYPPTDGTLVLVNTLN